MAASRPAWEQEPFMSYIIPGSRIPMYVCVDLIMCGPFSRWQSEMSSVLPGNSLSALGRSPPSPSPSTSSLFATPQAGQRGSTRVASAGPFRQRPLPGPGGGSGLGRSRTRHRPTARCRRTVLRRSRRLARRRWRPNGQPPLGARVHLSVAGQRRCLGPRSEDPRIRV